jgi:hypothetical protein
MMAKADANRRAPARSPVKTRAVPEEGARAAVFN